MTENVFFIRIEKNNKTFCRKKVLVCLEVSHVRLFGVVQLIDLIHRTPAPLYSYPRKDLPGDISS